MLWHARPSLMAWPQPFEERVGRSAGAGERARCLPGATTTLSAVGADPEPRRSALPEASLEGDAL